MVDLVAPTIGERVIDPACGTGGFLIRTYDVVGNKIRSSELTEQEKEARLKELANSCLVGVDWESRAARTCKMNMIIHGDGHAGVYQANSLDFEELEEKIRQRQALNVHAPSIEEGAFDIVLTNPPFGARDRSSHILRAYELGRRTSQKREVLMLERCIRLLRPGGRLAIVIPEGILSNKLDRPIRSYIRRECAMKAIIRLPQDAFQMSEGAACTSILYAVKRKPGERGSRTENDIFFARAEHIGISPSGKPIERNDLLAIREHYERFEAGKWAGIELRSETSGAMAVVRSAPSGDGLWLEPEVNRTSLLYDRLSYVVRSLRILDRFSYTYFHPRYYEILGALERMQAEVVTLDALCVRGYPARGKKPSQESSEGIPTLKVRNVTGDGIDLDTEYAPDNDEVRRSCVRALVRKGDILITSTGEGTIGRVDVYPYDDAAVADGHVTICRLAPGVNPYYVAEYLRSEYGQVQMLRHVSGSTGQTEVLREHVRSLRVPVPSPDVQEEIMQVMLEARSRAQGLRDHAQQLRLESAGVLAMAQQQMIGILAQQPVQ
jgi:type I restriction enzyme M protein